ncbi:MAG: SPOR domain-containing protein [Planctomycetota bacterium]|nr:SPOR domain-containing protein [Planctomycetota bacterium]
MTIHRTLWDRVRYLGFALALVGGVLAGLAAPGCAKSRAETPAQGYAALYDQGRFAEAYDAASKEASSRGVRRETAALYAGLSAYRLGRAGDAQRHLTPLTENADPGIAGRANAALGSLAAEQGTHGSAATYFLRASTRLTGDDAARALMYAGDARHAQGEKAEARQLWERARDKVASDVQLRVAIGDRLAGNIPSFPPAAGSSGSAASGGMHTVQVGAFSTRAAADRAAAGVRARGEVRVVIIRDSRGRLLHAVRVGRYSTKAAAEAVRTSIGGRAIVTTTAGE